MRTIQLNVYEFEELSDSVKEKVIERHREVCLRDDWWDWVNEDAENIGITIKSFGGVPIHCQITRNVSAVECAANIFREHGETCDTYELACEFSKLMKPLIDKYSDEESEYYESLEVEEQMIRLEDGFFDQLAHCYACMLQRDYEYRLSDEAVIDHLIANEYEFTEEGKLI